ncbi:hypothetical protein [uncultured Nocardioides sp.]|uniref:hypothetical protein n=1 Tax=uncultured Nocardioides sp. TaxID=198441 RepID=UPI002608BC1D|nr:hypothetical protein [uncultured Nocardioides sp.]
MAKRVFILHLGPLPVDTGSMAEALEVGGVQVPDAGADVLAHAEVEILRSHKAAGLRRKEVEGSWARVCRRARKTGTDCFVSMPGWSAATPEQAALALDGLTADFRVVLVATSGFGEPPRSWMSLVNENRSHVLPAHLSDEQLAAQVARIALMEEEARLDRRLAKVARRRRLLDRRPAA